MHQVLHREVQYIKQKFVVILVFFAALLPFSIIVVGMVMQIGYGTEFGNIPMSDNALITTAIFSLFFALLIILLFKFSNLCIEVRTDGFYYKYFPFHLSVKKIDKSEVQSVRIKKFRPIGDFGGWGIRYGFGKRGKGYIVSGALGVQFILNNGIKILFSTEEPEKMQLAIDKIF
ncbi:DUF6141 family protein [Bacteroidota bacterium]